MTLPALPTPNSITPAQVDGLAATVEEFAAGCDDIHEVREARNKWAAITEYIRRTSRDGVARAETAERRLEQRIGVLLGAMRASGELSTPGRPSATFEGSRVSDIGMVPFDASEFVAMAEHADIVDAVIASSTDASPPTRNKVRTAIRDHKTAQMNREGRTALEAAGVVITDDPIEKHRARQRTEIVAGLLGRLADMQSYADRFAADVIAIAVAGDRIADSIVSDIESASDWLGHIRIAIINHTTKEQQ
jgi:hypothetical protein